LKPRPLAAARLAVLAACLLLVAAPVRAGLEEFSTFSCEEQERDDESLLDHILTRTPLAWRNEWEHSRLAIRSAQGCLTSGQWFNATELKLSTSLGGRVAFGFALRQNESDRYAYNYSEFSVHVPTRYGTPGYMFRPSRDKASQDMAIQWDFGADTSAFQLHLVYGLEDVFNNFWEFRQADTGGRAQPYLRHPWEPGLEMTIRRPELRVNVGGRWLTPGERRVIVSYTDPNLDHLTTLWGTLAWASVETHALGIDWTASTVNHQAKSTDHPQDVPEPSGKDYRRQWWVETAARRPLGSRWSAEARWLYQERRQDHAPPVDPPRFEGIDRMIQAEAVWAARPSLALRVGVMRDRITIQQSQVSAQYSFGTRSEDRGYVGVIMRFGEVSFQVIEGIELDHEPYDVWLVHDKGFLQVQARF
jgi:hypothetical protein